MQTGLLAFHDASVAGQEASLLQGCAVRITIDSVQSAGNAQADCASLAGGAATVNEDDSVELAFELEQHDRGVDLTLQQLGREVLFQGATIDGPLAGARNQANTGDGFLTTTGAVARSDGGSIPVPAPALVSVVYEVSSSSVSRTAELLVFSAMFLISLRFT